MKKRILSLLLALLLLSSVTALAVSPGTGNFVRTKTYGGQFSDLTASSVFYGNVTALYEYGLSVGKANGTFGLTDSVSVGQLVIFAARIRSLYQTGDPESGAAAYAAAGNSVWAPYLQYLQSEGVLAGELDGLYGTAATRAAAAHVLAGTLPSSALPETNADLVTQAYATRKFITDVTEYTPYQQDILKLYRAGISQGSDASGSYLPAAPISRGAFAALLTRMVDASLRVTHSWNLDSAYSAKGTTLASLVSAGTYIAAPTAAEVNGDVRSMLASGSNTLTLQYGATISSAQARDLMSSALSAVQENAEQCYNAVNCSYGSDGSCTLSFYTADYTQTETASFRDYVLSAAIAVHDQLWENGSITWNMTQAQKARVYYTWICEHCTYDYGAGDTSLSHIAYSLFHDGTAVCDGYTGAYNLLLKLEGISCSALSNDDHMWTVATLDGTEVHIDTTWGDSGSAPDYTYFAMTAEQSWGYHQW